MVSFKGMTFHYHGLRAHFENQDMVTTMEVVFQVCTVSLSIIDFDAKYFAFGPQLMGLIILCTHSRICPHLLFLTWMQSHGNCISTILNQTLWANIKQNGTIVAHSIAFLLHPQSSVTFNPSLCNDFLELVRKRLFINSRRLFNGG